MNPALASTRLLALAAALSLAGCSSFENLMSGDKVDYRGQSQQKSNGLEVPPDLSQLAREGRYQPQAGVVSASTLRQQTTAPTPAATGTAVAPNAVADMRIERVGNVRYLVSALPADKLFPLVRSFWQERGFTLAIDNPEIGLMETEYAENRAKLPQDALRRTLGRVLDGLYSTPERDRFRTRIERTANGSEIYISHRGLQEIYTNEMKDATVWQPRPSDPELEAEFLSRLMVKLGSKEDTARASVAAAPVAAAPGGKPRSGALPATAVMDVADNFDRTWRQVGLALDRSGFTVEDRDRTAGLYFVRYIDPKLAGKEEPNFFTRLFSGNKDQVRPQRLRVLVKTEGAGTRVSVQTADGVADNSEQARTIIGKLTDEMR